MVPTSSRWGACGIRSPPFHRIDVHGVTAGHFPVKHPGPSEMTKPAFLYLGLACPLTLLSACFSQDYDKEIEKGTRAIKAATSAEERAAGYEQRGHGYSEKARYLRAFKRIARKDYDELFALAVRDYDQAVALTPSDAHAYLSRGLAYYFRAYPGPPDAWEAKEEVAHWVSKSDADLTHAIERDPNLEQAHDMRGVLHLSVKEYDAALQDFEQVRRLDARFGKIRLADTYCERGGFRREKTMHDEAIADYERARELGAPTDGCECDPYWPLAALYLDVRHDADKSWSVVHAARGKGWIAPEFIARLKKETHRDN